MTNVLSIYVVFSDVFSDKCFMEDSKGNEENETVSVVECILVKHKYTPG